MLSPLSLPLGSYWHFQKIVMLGLDVAFFPPYEQLRGILLIVCLTHRGIGHTLYYRTMYIGSNHDCLNDIFSALSLFWVSVIDEGDALYSSSLHFITVPTCGHAAKEKPLLPNGELF